MPGIALVTGEIDRAVDEDRQVRVDLDQAVKVALIPVVAAPRLAGDVLDRELSRRPAAAGARAVRRAALRDRRLEDRVELVARDDELLPERLDAIGERRPARQTAASRSSAPPRNALRRVRARRRRRAPATPRRSQLAPCSMRIRADTAWICALQVVASKAQQSRHRPPGSPQAAR